MPVHDVYLPSILLPLQHASGDDSSKRSSVDAACGAADAGIARPSPTRVLPSAETAFAPSSTGNIAAHYPLTVSMVPGFAAHEQQQGAPFYADGNVQRPIPRADSWGQFAPLVPPQHSSAIHHVWHSVPASPVAADFAHAGVGGRMDTSSLLRQSYGSMPRVSSSGSLAHSSAYADAGYLSGAHTPPFGRLAQPQSGSPLATAGSGNWSPTLSAASVPSHHMPHNGPASKTKICRYFLARSNNHFGKTCSYIHPCRNVLIEGHCRHNRRCTDDHVCREYLVYGEDHPLGCRLGDACRFIHVKQESDRVALLDMFRDWIAVKQQESACVEPGAAAVRVPSLQSSRIPCPFFYVDTQAGCKAGPECVYEHTGQFQLPTRPLPTPAQVRFAEKSWEKRRGQDSFSASLAGTMATPASSSPSVFAFPSSPLVPSPAASAAHALPRPPSLLSLPPAEASFSALRVQPALKDSLTDSPWSQHRSTAGSYNSLSTASVASGATELSPANTAAVPSTDSLLCNLAALTL